MIWNTPTSKEKKDFSFMNTNFYWKVHDTSLKLLRSCIHGLSSKVSKNGFGRCSSRPVSNMVFGNNELSCCSWGSSGALAIWLSLIQYLAAASNNTPNSFSIDEGLNLEYGESAAPYDARLFTVVAAFNSRCGLRVNTDFNWGCWSRVGLKLIDMLIPGTKYPLPVLSWRLECWSNKCANAL